MIFEKDIFGFPLYSRLFRNLTKEVKLFAAKLIDKGKVSLTVTFGFFIYFFSFIYDG